MQTYKKENGSTGFIGNIEYSKYLENSLQPNQISQGLYRCSPMAKKILAYVIADLNIVQWKDKKKVLESKQKDIDDWKKWLKNTEDDK